MQLSPAKFHTFFAQGLRRPPCRSVFSEERTPICRMDAIVQEDDGKCLQDLLINTLTGFWVIAFTNIVHVYLFTNSMCWAFGPFDESFGSALPGMWNQFNKFLRSGHIWSYLVAFGSLQRAPVMFLKIRKYDLKIPQVCIMESKIT